VARQRCWRYAWVLDLDIQSFFDQIDSKLLIRAVRKHTDCPWVLLYIERWLQAPVQMEDGSLVERERGTPQGGVVSPILSNLFLHYTFDFRPRLSRRRNGFGVSFSPAVSGKALKSIRQTVRHWTLHERSDKTLADGLSLVNKAMSEAKFTTQERLSLKTTLHNIGALD
jgi:retron-type reverse transcriptase